MTGRSKDTRAKPYSSNWMDSCYQETLLPGAPWHTLSSEICEALADYLHRQMTQPQRAFILARILGDAFMVRYFPDTLAEMTSNPPDISAEEQKKLTMEASTWLKAQLLKAAKKVGAVADDELISEDMKTFRTHTSDIFYSGLERELYHQEQQTIDEMKQEAIQRKNRASPEALRQSALGTVSATRQAASPAMSVTRSSSASTIRSVKTDRLKEIMYNLDVVPQHPAMTSKSIDLIAESVVKLLERSPGRFKVVAKRLHGRLLPRSLRTYIWTECLYQSEKDRLVRGANVERILRERFGKTVARNVGELRIKRATQSPIHRIIENSTLELYGTVPALATYRNQSMMKDAVKALNILYTYDRTYEPYLILWLFPLQLAFSSNAVTSGAEYVYELAMYLDILNSSLFTQWSNVHAVSDMVIHLLLINDKEFHDHLMSICQLNVQFKTKDFLLEQVQKERQEALKMLKKPPEQESSDPQQLLADPRMYIRKWIGEGFVSVLDTTSVMFVWDQLFLQGWDSTVLQDFTLVIMLLLRDRFLVCNDHMSMRQVFLDEPCKLLLMDIQTAWLKLHQNVSYPDLAACNRVRPTASPLQTSVTTPLPS
ncbi:uncharacterized protein [Watersipora subatra]|uniref:uncharacterized protein n=1 Tax=Watersipora subatra TaxID=2589382 RepID=UPI00355B566E